MYVHKGMDYICDQSFPFESRLKQHKITHCKVADHYCMVKNCNRSFKNTGDLNRHVNQHTGVIIGKTLPYKNLPRVFPLKILSGKTPGRVFPLNFFYQMRNPPPIGKTLPFGIVIPKLIAEHFYMNFLFLDLFKKILAFHLTTCAPVRDLCSCKSVHL